MSGAIAGDGQRARQSRALLVLVVLFAACVFSAPVADNDLWGHVYFGRAILAEGGLPLVNRYSYTAPDFPWINHEILAECLFAWTFDHAGAPGLLVLKTVVGLATLAIAARVMIRRGASPLVWGSALVWVSSLMAWGFLVRPQIFSSFALALLWDRLDAHYVTRRPSTLIALPLLFAIWVNTHGAVVAGVGILFLYVVLNRLRTSPVEWLPTAMIGASCALALLANPYGIKLPQFLWEDVTQVRSISEWQPIALLDSSFPLYKLAAATLLAGIFLKRGGRPWELATLGVAAVMTFRHQRHLPLFAIIAAPLLAETLEAAASRWSSAPITRIGQRLVLVGLVAITTVQLIRSAGIHRRLSGQIFVALEQFPVHAVDFLEENRLSGHLLLPFDWGEYAIWHLYPRCRVSIDGRYTTAYPRHIIESSQRFFTGSIGWEESLRDATIVLVDRRQPNALSLFAKPEWSYVYSDPTALLYVRSNALGQKPLVRHAQTKSDPAFIFP
jgi:hypothetical protein